MTVQQYKIKLKPSGNDNYINIPINIDFDVLGRDDDIDRYESQVIKEIIGEPQDFEVDRFAHANNEPQSTETKLSQQYYFYNTATTLYENTYLSDFEDLELYYFANSFTNSFFKLDFYDTADSNSQTNYLTQIIPVQQGGFEEITIFVNQQVKIRKPDFSLDYIGDKEGFFIYWLKKKTFLNIDKFYVSAKFFNAKIGQFVRLLNHQPPATKVFNQSDYFYYRYDLDYITRTYKVYGHGINPSATRFGVSGSPMKWYEYVNP